MSNVTATRKQVREIRAILKELTGKVPKTEDLGALRKKLAAVFADMVTTASAKPGVVTVVGERGGPVVVVDMVTAVLGRYDRRAIVNILAQQRKCAVEAVIRKAVDEHAVAHGLGSLVHEIQRKERTERK